MTATNRLRFGRDASLLRDRFIQALLLNPAGFAAAGFGLLLWAASTPALPSPSFDLERPVELTGSINSLPRFSVDQLAFRVAPDSLTQDGLAFALPGELDIFVRSSADDPATWFVPPLRFGDTIRIRTVLRQPSHYDVPGAVDPRWARWARGRYYYASLKSPRQLERLAGSRSVISVLLGPAFHYMDRFLRACDRLESFPAGLLYASLGGDSQRLGTDTWDCFQRLGLVHLLVVSGFHVALVAAAAGRCLARLGQLGSVLRLLMIWSFVAVTGAASPALRAAITMSLFLLSSRASLRARPFNLLGIAALTLLITQPATLYSRSFQFTFSAVLAILAARPGIEYLNSACFGLKDLHQGRLRLGRRPRDRIRRRVRFSAEGWLDLLPIRVSPRALHFLSRAASYAGSLLVICATVQVVLIPLLLFHTNQVSLSATLNNLLIVPPFTLFLVFGFLFLGLFWTPLAVPLAWGLDLSASFVRGMLTALDAINLNASAPTPPSVGVVIFLGLVAGMSWLSLKWRLALLALPLALLVPRPGPAPDGLLSVTLLDVGQSEAIHLAYPDGTHGLVDTGGSSLDSVNRLLARQVLARYLLNLGVRKLDFVIITHAESDHRGAYSDLIQMVPVTTTLHAESDAQYPGETVRLNRGVAFHLGGVEHQVLNPPSAQPGPKNNERSIVLEIRYRNFRMLLTGDTPGQVERRLIPQLNPVDALKVSHHGSRSSSTSRFLAAIRPQLGLISAGRRNMFGHPDPSVIGRLAEVGCPAFCTAQHGSLRLRTDGYTYDLASFTIESGSFRTVHSGFCRSAPSFKPQQ